MKTRAEENIGIFDIEKLLSTTQNYDDNSVQDVPIGDNAVTQLRINLPGSGRVMSFSSSAPEIGPVEL